MGTSPPEGHLEDISMAVGTLLLQRQLEHMEDITGTQMEIKAPQGHLEDICIGTWTPPPQGHQKLDKDVSTGIRTPPPQKHLENIPKGQGQHHYHPSGTTATRGWEHHHPRGACSKQKTSAQG